MGRGGGRDSDGGGREAGLGFGGRGGAEELLDRAVRSGLPLQSRSRSEEEWEVSSGGRGERERSTTPPSTPRLLRLRFAPCWGLRRPPLFTGGTLREWEKDRSECEVLGLGAESASCSFRVIVDRYVNGIPDGVQLLAKPPDDLINTALLAPPPRPSDLAPEEEDELRRFLRISRFKFSRLLLPLTVGHVSDLALLLEALKGIPPPFPPPPIPEPLLARRVCPAGGLASTGGLMGSCLALMTSWLLTYLALSASSLSTALRRFGFGSTCLLK